MIVRQNNCLNRCSDCAFNKQETLQIESNLRSSRQVSLPQMSLTQQGSVTTEPGDRQKVDRAIGSQHGSSTAGLFLGVSCFTWNSFCFCGTLFSH